MSTSVAVGEALLSVMMSSAVVEPQRPAPPRWNSSAGFSPECSSCPAAPHRRWYRRGARARAGALVTRAVLPIRTVDPGPGLLGTKPLPSTCTVKPSSPPAYTLAGCSAKILSCVEIVMFALADCVESYWLVATSLGHRGSVERPGRYSFPKHRRCRNFPPCRSRCLRSARSRFDSGCQERWQKSFACPVAPGHTVGKDADHDVVDDRDCAEGG